ncbi:MAG: cysteine--tRNA ligase [Desulfovibrionaceae bacterium]
MRLYNTLTHAKETFVPVQPGKVGLYVCGITAYDLCHVGHARSNVVFDVLARYLRSQGFELTFVRNFTDVDDKIIKRANELGQAPMEVAERNIQEFYTDMDRLGVMRPDVEPRCTAHIPEMIELTKTLVDKGHAYATENGDVYFKVRSFEGYGKLSGRDIEDLKAGARIAPGEHKKDPLDFALWKGAKPGEPSWDSPWGPGRPGWHLECSAMSGKYLPQPFDIHGGGQDLIFPHHENEIAQSEAATGSELAKFWVHNGFVQINSEKMSKSLGNFFTIRDILKSFLPETLRYFLLSMHYRSPLDFSFDSMEEAEKAQRRIYFALSQTQEELARSKRSKGPLPEELGQELEAAEQGFRAAMEDDLNTAAAMGQIFTLTRLAGRIMENKTWRKTQAAADLLARLQKDILGFGAVLGLFQQDPAQFLLDLRAMRSQRKGLNPAEIESLVEARQVARKNKNFEESDRLRAELADKGVEVQDTPAGPVWDVV